MGAPGPFRSHRNRTASTGSTIVVNPPQVNVTVVQRPNAPNPDPSNFRILRHQAFGNTLLVEVLYPDCTNFEGRKILVYRNATITELEAQGSVDPHFSVSTNYLSPFARFEPSREGWLNAIAFCLKALT